MQLQPVILCGGSGTRLWPLSREQSPKQLLAFGSQLTMLQTTALRIGAGFAVRHTVLAPLVVANEQYRFVTAEQLRQIDLAPAAIVLEPLGRNTAPALTVAALIAMHNDADPVLLVMPADHVIANEQAFRQALEEATRIAASGQIVTFGIVPTAPETGYGYIRGGDLISGTEARLVAGFAEKPDQARAQSYLESGDYFWNSGIFVLKASVWLGAIGKSRPAILAACQSAVADGARDSDFFRLENAAFLSCPADSIDYAVMEHLAPGAAAVVPLSAGWSDVGSWGALLDVGAKDSNGNLLIGDVIAINTRNTLVRAESRLVASVGLSDVVVVETPDAVLVADREHLQEIKQVVAQLKALGRSEPDAHRKVYRPWGYYDSIDQGERFQVKRIVVNPSSKLSLQMHHHRAEHWIVVSGTARVTRGEDIFLLSENESTYIPLGVRHRLENPGQVPLEIIEVQSGSYLGEDDIVRFEDTYGRA
jgi:mannose-1-phosphate guanylyltransferase/mannose-6-phosphate isomerase